MKTLPTTKRTRRPNGAVLYRGPSMLDGAPILVIITGLRSNSVNVKTGAMLQTWIIRADMEPHRAVRGQSDGAICGDCPHAGTSCYVQVERAPLQVFRAWKRGSYLDWTGAFPARALRGRKVRFGAYGDPAAVPFNVWRRVFEQGLAGWTGYTHQWRNPAFRRLRNYFMASADSPQDAQEAWADGWRTFRVRHPREEPIKGEVTCPASEEGGKRTNCAKCRLCQGQNIDVSTNVVIAVHGYRSKNFNG